MATEKRLIDANALIKYISERTAVTYPNLYPGLFKAIGYIRTFPTVDAVEVVHGRWIEKIDMVASYLAECEELFYECSVCNTPNFGESPYCPNCGAKMDGEE